MKNRICPGVAMLLVVFASAQLARGAIVLSLTTLADVGTLRVGDAVVFDVELSGLNPGDELEFLAATFGFDPVLLGSPLRITSGPIVPDPTGFTSAMGPGIADVFYDRLFAVLATNITANGVFYSFDVVVQAAGTGTIGLTFLDSVGADSQGDFILVQPGPDVAFSAMAPPTGAVPEPASYWIWAGTAFVCLGRGRLSRRRHQGV